MTSEEILNENLLTENRRIPALFERRIGHVAEVVDLMFSPKDVAREDLPGILADVGQRYVRFVAASAPDFSDLPFQNRDKAKDTFRMLSEQDAAYFALLVSKKLKEQKLSLFSATPFTPTDTFFVAYVENALSNTAFSAFRDRYTGAVPLYLDSVRESVNAVSAGRAALAIIPVSGVAGELSLSSLRYVEDRELSFCAAYASENDESVRFAFVSKSPLSMIFPATRMTCRLIPSSDFSAGSVLRAASMLGMTPLGFDTDRHSAHGNRGFFLTLSLDGTLPDAFIAYAYLFTASCTLYGVYGMV